MKFFYQPSLLVLIAFLSACNSKEQLKFDPAKGAKMEYIHDVQQDMTQTMFGQSVSSKSLVGTKYIFEVTDIDGQNKNMTATINGFRMKMEMEGQMPMSFDTDTPPPADDTIAGMMNDIFGSLKGGQFTFKVNEKGEVLEISGINEMLDKMVSGVNVPGVPKEEIIEQVSSNFNDETFKGSVQQSFNIFPDEQSVAVGDTWIKTLELNVGGMKMKVENTYTLESVEGEKAKLKLDSKVLPGEGGNYGGIEYEIKGASNGTLEIDKKTGLVLSATLLSDLDVMIRGEGMEMPASVKQTVIITGKLL